MSQIRLYIDEDSSDSALVQYEFNHHIDVINEIALQLMREVMNESVQFWRIQNLKNMELMRATYVTQSFPRHAHETFGFGIVEQGSVATFQHGTNQIIPTGNLILFNPDEIHASYAASEAGWTYRMLYPDHTMLEQVMLEVTEKPKTPFFPFATIQDRDLAHQMLRLHFVLEKSVSRLTQESYLLSTLTHLITRYTSDRPNLPTIGSEKGVTQVRDYLESYYTQNISLEQLAELTNLKPLRLLRAFRKEVGLPPHQYLIQVRIVQAKRYLAMGMPIGKVAIETGFTDQSHLTRHFKRLIGVTPKQYAQGCKNVQDNRR